MSSSQRSTSRRRVRIAVIGAVAALALVTLKVTVGSDQWVCQHITGGHWTKMDAGKGNADAYGPPGLFGGQPDYTCTKG